MPNETIIVDEIDGDDADLGTPVQRVVQRVEAPPKPKAKAKVATVADWPRIIMEDSPDIPPIGLFIGINGQSYMLRPGVEAAVPPAILEILNNSIITVPKVDPSTLQTIGWRDKLRFPYRIVKQAA